MSLEFGFCPKHRIRVFDYCPKCEPEIDKEVKEMGDEDFEEEMSDEPEEE